MGQELSESIQRIGVGDQVFAILKAKIASGEWENGDRIPSENELASQFGVSRMTIHNALQRLSTMGLLETKPGDGTYVRRFHLAEYFMEAAELIDNPKNMQDIREFRGSFEKNYLKLACERRSEEDLKDLKRIYARMKELSETEEFDAFFDADMDFHHRICQMADNEVYLMVESVLRGLLYAQLKDNTERFARVKNASMNIEDENYVLKVLVKEHMDFIDALTKRDPSLAADKLNDYFEKYSELED